MCGSPIMVIFPPVGLPGIETGVWRCSDHKHSKRLWYWLHSYAAINLTIFGYIRMYVQTEKQCAIMCVYIFHPLFWAVAAANCGTSPVPQLSELTADGISRIPSKALQPWKDEWQLSHCAALCRMGNRTDSQVLSEWGTSCRLLLPLPRIQAAQMLMGKGSVPVHPLCFLPAVPFIFEDGMDRLPVSCCQQ